MPASVNRVTLIGNLGQDPQLKQIPSGQSVTTFSLATNETYYDKEKKKQTRTDWHNIEIWGKAAELAAKHLSKGRSIFVEGQLRTDKWEKDGQTHYRAKVVVRSWQFNDHPEKTDAAGADHAEEQAGENPPADLPF